jgi:hypothetical protein
MCQFSVVVGVAVGTASFLLTVGLTIFVIFFTKKRKKRITTRDEETSTSDPQQEPLLHEVYEALNTQIRTSSQIVQSQESIDNVELSNKHYIPFEEIEIQKELAKGSYGRICLGLWNGAPVALKFCREREKIDDFWKEVNLLMYISIIEKIHSLKETKVTKHKKFCSQSNYLIYLIYFFM